MRSVFASAVLAAALIVFFVAPPTLAVGDRERLVVESASGEHRFSVEIADDNRERAKGLMFRRVMRDNEGMLFDFKQEQPATFWMRNTYISLDMLFIKADGTIESIARRATPLSEKTIPSKGPVRFVLEINGGLADRLGIAPGDRVGGPAMERRR
jgi:uncharacterized membrane protein (UPF0127 family)